MPVRRVARTCHSLRSRALFENRAYTAWSIGHIRARWLQLGYRLASDDSISKALMVFPTLVASKSGPDSLGSDRGG